MVALRERLTRWSEANDGGYSWVPCVGSFIVHMFVLGMQYSYGTWPGTREHFTADAPAGVLYSSFVDEFDGVSASCAYCMNDNMSLY